MPIGRQIDHSFKTSIIPTDLLDKHYFLQNNCNEYPISKHKSYRIHGDHYMIYL